MPKFGKTSFERLKTCDIRLVKLFREVVREFDCTVLEGVRDKETQEEYFRKGYTKLHWPDSKHNVEMPEKSFAVDVVPWPVNWAFEREVYKTVNQGTGPAFTKAIHNVERWFKFGGYVLGIAQQMGIPLTWGGDWNWKDMAHFELRIS
jgi:peptidoglycan L-alanyl-D-glutamate endopeptidase CwlK